jgi:hypothetical protein
MINNYKEFVKNRLNEEAEFGGNKAAGKLGGLLKNLLGGLVKDLKDDFKKPLEDFNKKLGNQKDKDSVIKVVNDYLKTHKATLDTSLEEVKTPAALVNTIEDNLRTAYASIKSTVANFGNDKYTFAEIFADSPDRTKKLMDKKEENFKKNVEQFSKDLVLSFGKPYGITKEDLEEPKNESYKIYEADEEPPTDLEQKEQIAQTGDEEVSEEDKKESIKKEENFKKLKADVVKWFDNTIYRNLDKTLEEIKKEEPKQEGGDLNKVIEDIPNDITQNKDSVKKMVDQLAKADKQTMIKVRDMLGLNKEDTPL